VLGFKDGDFPNTDCGFESHRIVHRTTSAFMPRSTIRTEGGPRPRYCFKSQTKLLSSMLGALSNLWYIRCERFVGKPMFAIRERSAIADREVVRYPLGVFQRLAGADGSKATRREVLDGEQGNQSARLDEKSSKKAGLMKTKAVENRSFVESRDGQDY
jgi:hypothetical protein